MGVGTGFRELVSVRAHVAPAHSIPAHVVPLVYAQVGVEGVGDVYGDVTDGVVDQAVVHAVVFGRYLGHRFGV